MNQIILKKKKHCCSHCGSPNHKINKCNDPSIQELIQEAEDACLVSHAFFWMWNPKKTLVTNYCIQSWLKEINPSELKILEYHFNTSQNNKSCMNTLSGQFYDKWINPYDEITIYGKMILFSDEKLKKWREFLCENFYLTPEHVRNRFWELCYPYHRFFIDMSQCEPEPFTPTDTECPICFGGLTQENTIKTGCNHQFCKLCVVQYMRAESLDKDDLSCPMCRATITKMNTQEKETFDILSTRFCKPVETAKKIRVKRFATATATATATTPTLVSQLILHEEAVQSRKKFLKNMMEALFWVFLSASISTFLTQVMKITLLQ